MKINKNIIAALVGGVAVVGAGLYYVNANKDPAPAEVKKEKTKKAKVANIKAVKAPKAAKPAPAVVDDEPVDMAWFDDLSDKDRKTARLVQKAIDNENYEDLKALLNDVKSASPEVREQYVDGLSWYGKNALEEITAFIQDPDKEVARTAFNHWDGAISSIEEEWFKMPIVEAAMNAITDPEMLEDMGMHFRSSDDESIAVKSLMRIVEHSKNKEAQRVAREAYEFITGEEYTTSSAAIDWIFQSNKD